MLTDEQVTAIWREVIRESTHSDRTRFARAIESAACAERDKRIAELEQELEKVRKDAERLDWLATNPVDTLNLFGRVTGDFTNWPKWIRADIDAAMNVIEAAKLAGILPISDCERDKIG